MIPVGMSLLGGSVSGMIKEHPLHPFQEFLATILKSYFDFSLRDLIKNGEMGAMGAMDENNFLSCQEKLLKEVFL